MKNETNTSPSETSTMKTTTINGTTYAIDRRETNEALALRLPSLAAFNAENGVAAMLTLRRPNGTALHMAHEMDNGTVRYVCNVGS